MTLAQCSNISFQKTGKDANFKKSWRHDVVVITIAQLHSTKPEFRFWTGSNPTRRLSEISNGENL